MSVGSALRAAREERGLTVADVSQRTRIRATLIGQIEADDFSSCGGTVYARGHLRAVAAAVGADGAALVAEFDRERAAQEQGSGLQAALEHERGGPEVRDRRGPNWLAAAVGAAAVATVLLGVGLFQSASSGPRSAGPGPRVSTAASPTPSVPPVAAPPPGAPASPAVPPPPVRTDPLVANGGVLVSLHVTAAPGSWVRVLNGTQNLFEGVIPPGTTREFRGDKQVTLRLGNAGAVDLTVNGKQLGSPGPTGSIRQVTFGPGDPTAGQG